MKSAEGRLARNGSSVGTQDFSLRVHGAFTLDATASFCVFALLCLTVDFSNRVSGVADAMHTMTLSFRARDSSLLVTELAAVPSPGSGSLLVVGVGSLGMVRRRGRDKKIIALAAV